VFVGVLFPGEAPLIKWTLEEASVYDIAELLRAKKGRLTSFAS
jgi:hypothetical protein